MGVTACGGGGGTNEGHGTQVVRGDGFRFTAPGDWHLKRQGSEVSATPKPVAVELVSVTTFPLGKPYRPALFAGAARELDRSTGRLASQLGGSVVKASTTTAAGERGRQYLLLYPQRKDDRKKYNALITYVLRGKTEYELFCRWDASNPEPQYCRRLIATFRPT